MGDFDAAVLPPVAIYLVPLLAMLGLYFRSRRRKEEHALRDLLHSRDLGLTEPVSMHPVINRNRCIGCGACVDACPQGDVLGVIGGQAELINPTNCISHGACATACPTDGIRLVIGSERRGVNIPLLTPDFQTNVPGVFVAGELGGMGLIRNAIAQGCQAIEAIAKLPGIGTQDDLLDTVIVGAGPAGFGASLMALQSGLDFVTVDQERLGGSLVHHPRGKIIVTEPVEIPLVGSINLRETRKEELLEFWERIRADTGLRVRENERVEAVERRSDGSFLVRTDKASYETRSVLLAVGRRGTPRKLEVPGEDTSKVVYSLSDPAQYRGRRMLVIGGGDSALEAAASLAQQDGTRVTLSYRGHAFVRACSNSREQLEDAVGQHELVVLMNSTVREIRADAVVVQTDSGRREIPNDAVVICAGGVLPNDFLRKIGVEVETKYGTPVHG